MSTTRSLNKLERKAHMSIHNTVDAAEPEPKDKNHTRDRFGKRHAVSGDGTVREVTLTVFFLFFILTGVLGVPAKSMADVPPQGTDAASGARRAHVTVDSADLGPVSLNGKSGRKEERPMLYSDDDVSVGFNEDGDPNMGMRF